MSNDKFRVELNTAGIMALMRSGEMQSAISARKNEALAKAGINPSSVTAEKDYIAGTRAVIRIKGKKE